MTTLDWILIAFVALTALGGLGNGLVATLLSLAGLVAGAVVGANLATELLPDGMEASYAGLGGIGGALVGAALLCAVARLVGSFVRGGLRLLPPLRLLDSIGGAALGAVFGFALVWAGGAVAMQVTDQAQVRREVKQSQVIQHLNSIVAPKEFFDLEPRSRPKPHRQRPANAPQSKSSSTASGRRNGATT
jgi:uncharacterized membrane protein required for colicin V production